MDPFRLSSAIIIITIIVITIISSSNNTTIIINSNNTTIRIRIPIKQRLKLIKPRSIMYRLLTFHSTFIPIPLIPICGGLRLIHLLTHNYIRSNPRFFTF